jgi:hypothetical protein
MRLEDKDAAIAWERAVLSFDLIDGPGQFTHANPAATQRGNVEKKVRAFWLDSDPEMASLGQAKARAQRQHMCWLLGSSVRKIGIFRMI